MDQVQRMECYDPRLDIYNVDDAFARRIRGCRTTGLFPEPQPVRLTLHSLPLLLADEASLPSIPIPLSSKPPFGTSSASLSRLTYPPYTCR